MKKPRFGIVVSRFNREITEKLHANCLRTLKKCGIPDSRIHSIEVPGGFEIPWGANELARSKRFDAVICLGAVLKGQTPQNDYISAAIYAALQHVSIATRVPCVVGILTPRTYAQALARTRGRMDRGSEAALAAIEMAGLKIRGAA